jgi:hypothetical protein
VRVILVTALYAAFVFGLYFTAGHTIAVVAGLAVFTLVVARDRRRPLRGRRA